EPLGDRLAALDVAGPYRAGQAVACVVGSPNRIVDVRELQDRHDGPELLLLHEAAARFYVGYECRRDEVAPAFRHLAAGEEPRAAAFGVLAEVAYLVVLHLVLVLPLLPIGIETVAYLRFPRFLAERVAKCVVDLLVR